MTISIIGKQPEWRFIQGKAPRAAPQYFDCPLVAGSSAAGFIHFPRVDPEQLRPTSEVGERGERLTAPP